MGMGPQGFLALLLLGALWARCHALTTSNQLFRLQVLTDSATCFIDRESTLHARLGEVPTMVALDINRGRPGRA